LHRQFPAGAQRIRQRINLFLLVNRIVKSAS
jgi:hypothetical protein